MHPSLREVERGKALIIEMNIGVRKSISMKFIILVLYVLSMCGFLLFWQKL